MPQRFIPFVTNEYYHVYNRGVEKRHIFIDPRSRHRFLDTWSYYLHADPPMRFSQLMNLDITTKEQILKNHSLRPSIIKILAYVLMPNHFHLLITQEVDGAITNFMRRISDSYTKYFNTREKRVGPLFQGQFKAVHISTNEQLLHVSRYIHLNPYTSRLVSTMEELQLYPWSSLSEYIKGEYYLTNPEIVLSQFNSQNKYVEFLQDQADYQRSLEDYRHLTLED